MKVDNQQIKIHNSLSGEKEVFQPITPGFVGMYVCGPTVYSFAHLGNLRTFMSFDIIYRYLLHLGYKVRYVRNITDVGHLLDDEEEDKIAKQSKLEQIEPMEVVQKYTVDFHTMLNTYNLLPPSIEPTATGHIMEQIDIIRMLIDNGLAYESNGSVYFDVLKYNETENYGELSKRKLEDMISHTRTLDGQEEKKNPHDFALWKKAMPEHIMRWESPWGVGFPGWHIECTAMSTKYLGEQFDIHGGGMDLKFPHHECEIAQAKGSNQKAPVQFWVHTNMLTLNGQKMSKSTGNFVLPLEIVSGENTFFEKPIHPMVIRYFFLQAHYSSMLDLSNEAVLAAEKGFVRLQEALRFVDQENPEFSDTSDIDISEWSTDCYAAMNDDFNTPILMSHLFTAVKWINSLKNKELNITENDYNQLQTEMKSWFFDVLGLQYIEEQGNDSLDAALSVLIELRNEARAHKNFALSDAIRDKLSVKGIQLKDGKEGTTYQIN